MYKPSNNSTGPLLMLGSAIAFSVMSVLVKYASHDIPLGQLVFARAVVTLILAYFMVRHAHLPLRGNNPRKLVTRGLIGFCGLTCYYSTLGELPLAHATLIQNAVPVFTALLAWWWLREKVTPRVALAIAIGLAGVLVVNLLPSLDAHNAAIQTLPIIIAVMGTVFSSIVYVKVRELSKTDHPLVIVMYLPMVTAPLSLPWALWHWIWPNATQALLLVGIGVATQIGQVCMTRGLSLLPAGRATALGYVQTLFAMGWGVVLFGEAIHLGVLIGAVLIGTAVLIVATSAKPSDLADHSNRAAK
jgi:drug/metabolite transporter (DMT)-like permease